MRGVSLLLSGWLLLLNHAAQAEVGKGARRAAVAGKLAKPPVIDGALVDWSPGMFGVAPPITLGKATSVVESGKIADDDDHSVELYAAVTDSALYVAGIVTDDQVVDRHRAGEMWRGDMVEVLVAKPKGGYLHVGVNPAGDAFLFAPLTKGGAAAPRLRSAARKAPPGYAFELEIPFSLVGLAKGSQRLTVNFAARDADPGESPPGHRTWSGYRHNLLGSFGTLVVDGGGPAPSAWPRCREGAKEVVVESPLRARGHGLVAGERPVVLRMANYQSAEASWVQFWSQWDLARVQRELDLAARLQLNAIRIFVFFEPFGGRTPAVEMVSRLETVVDEAAKRGILTVVSFFPFDKDFRPERYEEMAEHLRHIVSRFRGDPAIAMWDLMNEPDHMWMMPDAGVTPSAVSAWASHMYPVVREADPTHLVTVGLAGHFAVNPGPVKAEEALPFVDVVSVHWYFDLSLIDRALAKARSLGKPLVLQEFGASGLLFSEDDASAQFEVICRAAEKAEVAGLAVWELFDHPVGTIAHYPTPWREDAENYFGLLRADGTPKRQAGIFCRCLDAPKLKLLRSPTAIPRSR